MVLSSGTLLLPLALTSVLPSRITTPLTSSSCTKQKPCFSRSNSCTPIARQSCMSRSSLGKNLMFVDGTDSATGTRISYALVFEKSSCTMCDSRVRTDMLKIVALLHVCSHGEFYGRRSKLRLLVLDQEEKDALRCERSHSTKSCRRNCGLEKAALGGSQQHPISLARQ